MTSTALPQSNFSKKVMSSKYENDTASVASNSTFSSTISLLKTKFRPSPYKSSYPETSGQDYPRWGPSSDLDPAMASKSSKSHSKPKSSDKKEKRSKTKSNYPIINIGIGAGAVSYTPFRTLYPESSKDFPKWGPQSDLDEKMIKVDEEEEDEKERMKREKAERKKEKAIMAAERKRMDREMNRFTYTTASLMRP